MKALNNEGEGYLLSYQAPLIIDAEEANPLNPNLAAVLEEFDDLFKEPTNLPPKRTCDHAINLKEGVSIPNIRPYRYPFYRKNEIEKFVKEMMIIGIIRPSNSPCNNPVILVKKKDGGW